MSLFGGGDNKPAGGGGLFGQGPGVKAAGGGGLFGTSTGSAAAAAPSGGLFGSGNTLGSSKPAAAAPTGGLFGSNNAAPTGGLFGTSNTAVGGGLFGSGATTATDNKPATTSLGAGGGLFGGATATTDNKPATTGGLFGGGITANKTEASKTGGLFGAANTTTTTDASKPAATTEGVFGAASTASTTDATKPAATTGGLFGTTSATTAAETKPAVAASTGGLFGASAATSATAPTTATANNATVTNSTTNAVVNQSNRIEAIYYDRMDDTLSLWDKRVRQQVVELGQYYKNMTTVDQEIETAHKMIIQLEKDQDEAEREQHELCVEMKALESKQISLGKILCDLESQLGQIIDNKMTNADSGSYLILTDDHPSAALQDQFHAVAKRVEKADARADAYQKRLAVSLSNVAQMNGLATVVELLNAHQVALDGMSEQLDTLLDKSRITSQGSRV